MPLQATSGAASYDAFGGGVAVVPNYIEDIFSCFLYTGDATARTITNGIDLSTKGGLVWLEARSTSGFNHLADTIRGGNKWIYSDLTQGQDTVPYITAFNTDGFSLNTSSAVNASGTTYASWTFRKSPKFFDVVTYTGNESLFQTVSHNLGSTPGCIIVKCINADNGNWRVYHRGLPSAAYRLNLNTTAAQAIENSVWNSTAPTSTVFTVGGDLGVNNPGDTYVAYLFAHDAGGFGLTGTDNVISCGSFTTTDGVSGLVNTGFEPQWVLIKRTDSSTLGDWQIYDNMRGVVASNNGGTYLQPSQFLKPNLSNAEGTDNYGLGIYQNGFNFNDASGTSTYIYIAIRRGPMKVPTDGTKVFAPIAYTGNNTSQALTTGFSTDAAFIVRRNTDPNSGDARNRNLIDKLRGTTQDLFPNTTAAESAYFGSGQVVYNNTQVLLNFGGDAPTNKTGGDFVLEAFQRAPGFFDAVCYTGTGSAATIPHNLGAVPEFYIVKSRSSVYDWWCYHSALGNTQGIKLNTTAAAIVDNVWNNTSPTSSNFYIANNGYTSQVNQTYVAYLFATCPGVSKVGSYTGTGTTQTINCGFTAGARFVLIKRTDSTGDWYVWDTARGIVSGNDPYLLLNSTAAEVTITDFIDPASTGFELSSTALATVNVSGGTYIFLAIA